MRRSANLAEYLVPSGEGKLVPSGGGKLVPSGEGKADAAALIVDARVVTYRQLEHRVSRWRGSLAAAAIRPGDRVAVVAENGEEFVAAHLAILGVGAASAPLNPQSPPVELARELAMITPVAVVCDAASEAAVFAALTAAGTTVATSVLPADYLDRGLPASVIEVASSDPAVLLFTSGTAGRPKPAVLTHGNLLASLQAALSSPVDLVDPPHTFIGVIPMFHIFGLNTVLHLALLTGGCLVLGNFDGPEATIDLIERHAVSVVAGPPTLWQALCRHGGDRPERFASVKIAVSGAAKLPPRLQVDVRDRLGFELHQGYGLTETSAVVASSMGTDAPLGSVGRLLPGVEARIVDDQDDDCLVGDPGELLVRGPMVFSGYLDAPGPVTDDGWLRTGDVAVVDGDGYLAIVDRRKDIIIVSGFNVYPGEVELVLALHPDVAEVGVVGEPSERTGEAIVAFVVPEQGVGLAEEELRRHCEHQLARYKVPVRFVIKPGLPVGPTGKLRRTRLR